MTERRPFLLTIGIPTWNRSNYVSEAVDMLASEIEKHSLQNDVEIFISDNGSEDDTQAAIKERAALYPYVRYMRNERNMGVKFNVLQVLRLAEGKYATMIGDDDRLVEGALLAIIQKLRDNPELPALFIQHAGHNYDFQDIEQDTLLSFEEIYRRYFYDIGNAGVFMVDARSARQIIEERGLEFFNDNWPQTQVLCLSLARQSKATLISPIKAVNNNLHDSLSVYSAYYLWQVGFADLFMAARDMKSTLGEKFWQEVSVSLCSRMESVVNGVLFYGSLVDTKEQRLKTASNIRRLIPLLPWKLRLKAFALWLHVRLPRTIVAPLYKTRIFLFHGTSQIKLLNEQVKAQIERRALAAKEPAVRENV
jgi:glycosyltransferase involved in cell wall biosynthesis